MPQAISVISKSSCAIFYIHQTRGACSVNCACNCIQNSAGTRCHGFLVLESWCCGFMSPEKTPWSHDVVAYLSPFLDVVFSSPNISVTVFWLWNLDVVFLLVLESRCCGIFVSTASFSFSSWKQKNHAQLFQLCCWKNVSVVQIYATSNGLGKLYN